MLGCCLNFYTTTSEGGLGTFSFVWEWERNVGNLLNPHFGSNPDRVWVSLNTIGWTFILHCPCVTNTSARCQYSLFSPSPIAWEEAAHISFWAHGENTCARNPNTY